MVWVTLIPPNSVWNDPRSIVQRCEQVFLINFSGLDHDHRAAVLLALHVKFALLAGKQAADILLRVDALYLPEKHVAHLIVLAGVGDLPHHFIVLHRERSYSVLVKRPLRLKISSTAADWFKA